MERWELNVGKYLMKLMPVPGIEKDTHKLPVGDRPIRRPEKPQLKPAPFLETVALAPPKSPMVLRQRQPMLAA